MKEHLLEFFEKIPDTEDILIKGYKKDTPSQITCSEFRKTVFSVARFIKDKSILPGDRIAIITEKCPETIAIFFGVWLNGAVSVPICETLQAKELAFIVKDSGAKIILCSGSMKKQIEEILSSLNVAIYDFSSWEGLDSEIDKKSFIYEKNPQDIAFLIYTSGSTGTPKGVMLTHQNMAVNAAVSAQYIGMNNSDALMSILPYWHSFAITAEVFTMLHVGGKIFIPKNKSTFLKDVFSFSPTIILSVPRIAEMIKKGIEGSVEKNSHLQNRIKENFGGNIKYFIGGGAPLDTSLQEFFLSIGIPMYQGYGLTEASPVISINAPHNFKIGTSGCIIPWLREEYGGDYTFEDEAGNRDKKIKGELLVKGKCVMKGYWHMEEETNRALEDGWLHTGDMGYIDEDGFLILFGRKKSLLCLKGGEKFYPEFIEERLKTSLYITNAMVVGEGCTRCGVVVNYNQDLLQGHPLEKIDEIVAEEIRKLTKDFEVYQRPIRHLILPEFTEKENLLTNTLKIRRHEVLKKYKKDIEGLLFMLHR